MTKPTFELYDLTTNDTPDFMPINAEYGADWTILEQYQASLPRTALPQERKNSGNHTLQSGGALPTRRVHSAAPKSYQINLSGDKNGDLTPALGLVNQFDTERYLREVVQPPLKLNANPTPRARHLQPITKDTRDKATDFDAQERPSSSYQRYTDVSIWSTKKPLRGVETYPQSITSSPASSPRGGMQQFKVEQNQQPIRPYLPSINHPQQTQVQGIRPPYNQRPVLAAMYTGSDGGVVGINGTHYRVLPQVPSAIPNGGAVSINGIVHQREQQQQLTAVGSRSDGRAAYQRLAYDPRTVSGRHR